MSEELRIDEEAMRRAAQWRPGDPGGWSEQHRAAADFAAEVDHGLRELPVDTTALDHTDRAMGEQVDTAFAEHDAHAQDVLNAARRIVDNEIDNHGDK